MSFSTLIFLDAADLRGTRQDTDMQTRLVQCFLSEIPINIVQNYSQGRPIEEICEWCGDQYHFEVTCTEEGILSSIKAYGSKCGNYRIHFLPHSVVSLIMTKGYQKYAIETRQLPKLAQEFAVDFNRLFGTLNLATLPPRLHSFTAAGNRFTGTIELTHLPETLTLLSLGGNCFSQEVVFYANLPKNLRAIFLGGCGIGGVHRLPVGASQTKYQYIFLDMKHV